MVGNVEQKICNLGAGTSQDSTVLHVISPNPFLPNAAISSPQAQLSSDVLLPPPPANADRTSIPTPTTDGRNVQHNESTTSMRSANHSDDGNDVNAAAAATAVPAAAAGGNTPAEEVMSDWVFT